eukprot:NODE_3601_length_906_cov_7.046674_g2996_i0.p3 GENE.NODE_3601_length_906_cov_7.046674_g2996_i0~~NODE_3601_length_906_cov_7.046674_g2996_i0.p3  ORF type:complete len:55 (+),score=2.03 NODE_3601_length_906_cov_7.046674_g2996_i0:412-576(+)
MNSRSYGPAVGLRPADGHQPRNFVPGLTIQGPSAPGASLRPGPGGLTAPLGTGA